MRTQSMLREKPTQMEKLMDEMEVAESSDVALELPRILFDAVVDFEAPMKAAAVAPQEGSKSADSSIRVWRQTTCSTLTSRELCAQRSQRTRAR